MFLKMLMKIYVDFQMSSSIYTAFIVLNIKIVNIL